MNTRLRLSGRLTGAVVLVALATAGAASTSAPPDDERPHFTASGALLRPTGWERWVMVGASIGLSYASYRIIERPSLALRKRYGSHAPG